MRLVMAPIAALWVMVSNERPRLSASPANPRHYAGINHLIPLAAPAFRRFAQREAAVAIGIEQAELKLVGTDYGVRNALHGLSLITRAAVGGLRCREEFFPCLPH